MQTLCHHKGYITLTSTYNSVNKIYVTFTGDKKSKKTRWSLEQNGAGNLAQAFQSPRRDRENFRKALVDIIM